MDITYGLSSSDHFLIDDLLDFSNDHDLLLSSPTTTTTTTTSSTSDSVLLDHFPQNPLPSATPSSAVAVAVAVNYNTNRTSTYADDLCLPNEDVAELEWLSNFVDESFSDFSMNDDLSLTSASKSTISAARNTSTTNFRQQPSSSSSSDLLPEKTKSKRLRVTTPSNESNHYMIWNTNSSSSPPPEYESPVTCGKSRNSMIRKTMKEISSGIGIGTGIGPDRQYGSGRKCTHCESEKTPQWRTGPMGPKTLCNACGVRYKSGRLVPEYRPAASPTFVLTQHSNSHRKVMELRRQKEEEESMNNTNTNTGTGHLSHGTTTRQDHHHLLLPSDPHDYFHHHHFQVC